MIKYKRIMTSERATYNIDQNFNHTNLIGDVHLTRYDEVFNIVSFTFFFFLNLITK